MTLEIAKRILGLHYALTEQELKAIYRKLCLELHPDVNKSPNAAQQFRELNEAYEFVRNNMPMLPPPPLPKGYKIFEIFKSMWPVVYVPNEVDEDVLLHYIWKGSMGIVRIPKEVVAQAPCVVKYDGLEINVKRESEYQKASQEDPDPPIGTVWGRDYSIKRDQSQPVDKT